MIDANELRKGTTFLLDGELYEVLEYQHYNRDGAMPLSEPRYGTCIRAPLSRRTS